MVVVGDEEEWEWWTELVVVGDGELEWWTELVVVGDVGECE